MLSARAVSSYAIALAIIALAFALPLACIATVLAALARSSRRDSVVPADRQMDAWYLLVRIPKCATTSVVEGLRPALAASAVRPRCLGVFNESSAQLWCDPADPPTCDEQPLLAAYCDASPSTARRCTGFARSWAFASGRDGCTGGVVVNPHMSLGALRTLGLQLQLKATRFLVMLRQPMERAMSEYAELVEIALRTRQVRKGEAEPTDGGFGGPAPEVAALQPARGSWEYADQRFGSNVTLEAWLDCAPCAIGWSNRQTRMIGLEARDLRGHATGLRHGLLAPVSDLVYARAARRLDEMAWVGIVERFEESWALLATEVMGPAGIPLDRRPPHRTNTAESKGASAFVFEPTPEQRRRLERENEFDARLYRHGVQRLERDLAAAAARKVGSGRSVGR